LRKNKWKFCKCSDTVPEAAESASKGSVAATATAQSTNTADDATKAAANKRIIGHCGTYRELILAYQQCAK